MYIIIFYCSSSLSSSPRPRLRLRRRRRLSPTRCLPLTFSPYCRLVIVLVFVFIYVVVVVFFLLVVSLLLLALIVDLFSSSSSSSSSFSFSSSLSWLHVLLQRQHLFVQKKNKIKNAWKYKGRRRRGSRIDSVPFSYAGDKAGSSNVPFDPLSIIFIHNHFISCSHRTSRQVGADNSLKAFHWSCFFLW